MIKPSKRSWLPSFGVPLWNAGTFVLAGPTLRAKWWRLVYEVQWPWLLPRLRGGRRR